MKTAAAVMILAAVFVVGAAIFSPGPAGAPDAAKAGPGAGQGAASDTVQGAGSAASGQSAGSPEFTSEAAAGQPVRQPRIVMADDEESDKKVIPREFRKLGCEIVLATIPEEADPADYDALVIPGGGDVDPKLWGEEPHPAAGPFTPEKDRFQIEAIRRFAEAGKPILGICRGEQLINVAFGGTMIQNLYPDAEEPAYEDGFHKVKTKRGSWVRDLYGKSPKVYFHHHQAADELGEGIIATAWSVDHEHRHIEAIQHETLPVYGVQWHPDAYVEKQGNAIFVSFYQICLEKMEGH